jgi:hypothetical protein
MAWLGNIFTDYRYFTTDIQCTLEAERSMICSEQSGLLVEAEHGPAPIELPEGSPFASWHEARRYAGPLPFTFSWDPRLQKVLIVEGVHEDWQPCPARIVQARVPFLEKLGCSDLILANAFSLENVPYRWKKGRLESCTPTERHSKE